MFERLILIIMFPIVLALALVIYVYDGEIMLIEQENTKIYEITISLSIGENENLRGEILISPHSTGEIQPEIVTTNSYRSDLIAMFILIIFFSMPLAFAVIFVQNEKNRAKTYI